MKTQSDNFVLHNANASNLDKRYTVQKPSPRSFLKYLALRKQTTETNNKKLARKGCEYRLEMDITGNIDRTVAQKQKKVWT